MSSDRESQARQLPHGFVLTAEDDRLLRGPVPERALRWAAAAIGAGARVGSARALSGGTSSAVHALNVERACGRVGELVLRRFVRLDWLAEEPDVAIREAAALTLVAASEPPTPRLVAVDPDGELAGAPAVLMTMLPGRIEWNPPELEAFLRALAELLVAVHATPIPAGAGIPPYEPYDVKMPRAPAWASEPEAWRRAIEVLEGSQPEGERLFIHRDYHPGNVLWRDRRVSGLVDWVNASIGSPWADVGHCRVNLAGECSQVAAARFLALYRAVSGRCDEYHPYWDISAVIGGLDQSADTEPSPSDERFLAAAVARL